MLLGEIIVLLVLVQMGHHAGEAVVGEGAARLLLIQDDLVVGGDQGGVGHGSLLGDGVQGWPGLLGGGDFGHQGVQAGAEAACPPGPRPPLPGEARMKHDRLVAGEGGALVHHVRKVGSHQVCPPFLSSRADLVHQGEGGREERGGRPGTRG